MPFAPAESGAKKSRHEELSHHFARSEAFGSLPARIDVRDRPRATRGGDPRKR